MVDDFRQAFIDEACELLSDLEVTLIDLEKTPNDQTLIAKAFRSLHTIKGSSGMFGYPNISKFTHNIENIFHQIRIGELKITKDIIDLTLLARDQISVMLESDENTRAQTEEVEHEILAAIGRFLPEYNSTIINNSTKL